MTMVDLILKKRNGGRLTQEELLFWIQGYIQGAIPDYQVAALLMAIYFQGLDERETQLLTSVMATSGEQVDLSSIAGIKVDKHSTGGVGDKTTLVLAALVAACDIPVAKMSGRGLGHTGGTLDKLEAIPGFQVEMSLDAFVKQVNEKKLAVMGQTYDLAPADKLLYGLRDVTGTVDQLGLIASSIMSKKLAAGADAIVLDVKTGAGAFMKSLEDSFRLAEAMVSIGLGLNRNTLAVITDMDQPLGYGVGNSLEVIEAIETLKGRGPQDLTDLCVYLGSQMVLLAKKAPTLEEAAALIQESLKSGKALRLLEEMIVSQQGDKSVVADYSQFPQPLYTESIASPFEGYVTGLHAEKIGQCALALGAGRETKESKVDLSAGLVLHKKRGEWVIKGEPLATLSYSDPARKQPALEKLLDAYRWGETPPPARPLIFGLVSGEGRKRFT